MNGPNFLFHLLLLSNAYQKVFGKKDISICCFFNILLPCHCSLRFPFTPHFVPSLELVHGQKTQQKKELCVESLTKEKCSWLLIHWSWKFSQKNTIGLSFKRVTFTSGTNEKLVFLRQQMEKSKFYSSPFFLSFS